MSIDVIRFFEKVDVKHPSGCWQWLGAVEPSGYGMFRWEGKPTRVHRVSYELFHGTMAEGLVTDHLCRNKRCVNPDHLEAVTDRTNILRGVSISAENARKTHCKHGHPLSGENLKTRVQKKNGQTARNCKACNAKH